MNEQEKKYWFPAKKYGWGWSFPNCWQGWAVFGVWWVCLLAGTPLAATNLVGFIAYVMFLAIALVIVCFIKGEPPRFRWGDDK